MQYTFSQRVIECALSIPEGRVTTYGMLARAAGGGAQSARSVTGILTKFPNKSAIPFHRIVYSDGRAWMTPKCEKKRRGLYRREDIEIDTRGYIQNFEEILYDFSK